MHKSRLGGFIIDCQGADLGGAAAFWGAALGMRVEPLPGTEGQRYIRLYGPDANLHVEVQTVEHPSRVHLDIETDDIEAEVHRLEALGAKRLRKVETWWVIEAPTGQRFCVVRSSAPRFAELATEWR